MSIQPPVVSCHRCTPTGISDDTSLVEAARCGDTNAFALLYQRYSARINRTLQRMFRNPDDAQDTTQEAFLKAFVHLNAFEGKAKFSSWLTRIAINCALMEMRRRRGRCMLPIEASDDSHAKCHLNLIDNRVDIHGAYEIAEMLGLVTEAIDGLQPALREVIEFQLTVDCSHRDLAAMTNSSIPAVKARVTRARKALRASLSKRLSPR